MSRFLALLVVAATAAACDGAAGQTCTLVGCRTGLNLAFDGLDATVTYQIVVAVTAPADGVVPIASCVLMPDAGGSSRLYCSSGESHSEAGNLLNIEDTSLQQIQVTVSTSGAQVLQQTVDVTYTSSEINGPGCGVCTETSVIHVGP
jgi:hypothetical protein